MCDKRASRFLPRSFYYFSQAHSLHLSFFTVGMACTFYFLFFVHLSTAQGKRTFSSPMFLVLFYLHALHSPPFLPQYGFVSLANYLLATTWSDIHIHIQPPNHCSKQCVLSILSFSFEKCVKLLIDCGLASSSSLCNIHLIFGTKPLPPGGLFSVFCSHLLWCSDFHSHSLSLCLSLSR